MPTGTPDYFVRCEAAAAFLRSHTTLRPSLGVVLGSGLGHFASRIDGALSLPYQDIPGWPVSTVEGHAGHLLFGTVAGIPVAVMAGRVHAYEGYTPAEITFPIRVLGLLGCRALILTNAAGGINPALGQGTLVAITDHINLTGTNALIGPNEPRFATTPGTGLRFFDMSTAYSPRLRTLAQAEAARLGIALPGGVYLAVLGPSFETPAEIRAFRTLGADLVGMSTVHETTVARHMGLEVLGLSLVTNLAAGITDPTKPPELRTINHEEVMAMGKRMEAQFTTLLQAVLPHIAVALR